MPEQDLLEALVDKIAEAVVAKIEEHRKIDLIAEAVLARLEARQEAEEPNPAAADAEGETGEPKPVPRQSRRPTGKKTIRKK
jgi:hypothetical protein